MDGYRGQDMGDVIFGEPFCKASCMEARSKIIKEGKIGYFQIIRAYGSSRRYSSMIKMLQNIDKEDLETLWKLVKAKHENTRPEEAYKRVLWDDLKVMFELDIEVKYGGIYKDIKGQFRSYFLQVEYIFGKATGLEAKETKGNEMASACRFEKPTTIISEKERKKEAGCRGHEVPESLAPS
ncbi:hypothetical protein Tco_0548585 [Tanacetum coccineum]